jgi:hypothetical protein
LPHPRRQALKRDVHGRDRVAAEELRLVEFEHAKRNAEQDVESIEEQDVPHAEKRLKKTDQKTMLRRQRRGVVRARTSTGRQSVKRERNHEKQIAGRSMPSSARCAASFGMPSCT